MRRLVVHGRRSTKILRIVAVLTLLGVPGALTGPQPAGAQSAATPETLAAARELIAIVSKDTVGKIVTQNTAQIWPMVERDLRSKQPNISAAVLAELRAEFERIQLDYMSNLMEDAPAIYARRFSAAELRELLAFYGSPIGTKASTLTDDALANYAGHFSAAEQREVLAFYRSPIGAKVLRELPQIMAETMALIWPRMLQLQAQTMEAFTKVLRARGVPN